MTSAILGVDIGGVIIDRVKGDASDTSMFSGRWIETPEVEGAIDAVADLAKGRFGGRVHVVSKAGNRMRIRSLEWLKGRHFFGRTGIPEGNLHFCYNRRDKTDICRRLGVTHFVDDRCEVLSYISPFVGRLILFRGEDRDARDYPEVWPKVVRVASWAQAKDALLRD